jgi:hypothetical protein
MALIVYALGFVLASVGAALIYPPAGLIVLGLGLIVAAVWEVLDK